MPVTPSAVTPFVEKMAKRMDDMAEAAELEVGALYEVDLQLNSLIEAIISRSDDGMAEAAELEVGIRFKSVYCSPLSAAFGGLPSHGGAAELEVG